MTLPMTELQQLIMAVVEKHHPVCTHDLRDVVLRLAPWATPFAIRNAVTALIARGALIAGEKIGKVRTYRLGQPDPQLVSPLARAPEHLCQAEQVLHTLREAGRWVAPLELVAVYEGASRTRIYGMLARHYRDGWLHRSGKGSYVYRAATLEERASLRARRRREGTRPIKRARPAKVTPSSTATTPIAMPLWAAAPGTRRFGQALLGTPCMPPAWRNAA